MVKIIRDHVLKIGVSVDGQQRGKILKIVPPHDCNKLANLKKHNVLKSDPNDIVHINWFPTQLNTVKSR